MGIAIAISIMALDPLQLHADGYFYRSGKRFVPVGVNYWPASCGTDLWTAWPEAEIREDLKHIAELGLNAIRFFIRWDAFQPESGKWNPVMLERLNSFLAWCEEAGVYAQPTLFVGWMSGAIFWPDWKAGRNLFMDPEIRLLSADFARKIAEICRNHHSVVMGMDLGNELCCLPESREAPAEDITAWCQAVTAAVREAYPETWLISGNEQNQITSDCGWSLGQAIGTDCLSMHSYPVPTWHPVGFDGMRDPFSRSFLPFYVKAARTFCPVMVQEFGTILTQSPQIQREFLEGMLHASWQAGANGFLLWCWSDFACNQHPYNKGAFEKDLGLVDVEGRVKGGLDYFVEFAKKIGNTATPARNEEVALYWPKHYYSSQENPGNSPSRLAPRMLLAHYLLERAGFPTAIVKPDMLEASSTKVLVIAGAALTTEEITDLKRWVKKGGQVLWHGADPMNMGPEFRDFCGFAALDFRFPGEWTLDFNGESWKLDQFPHGTRVDVEMREVEPAFAVDGIPLGVRRNIGAGRVLTFLPDVEGCVMRDAGNVSLRDRWSKWYGGMIRDLLS